MVRTLRLPPSKGCDADPAHYPTRWPLAAGLFIGCDALPLGHSVLHLRMLRMVSRHHTVPVVWGVKKMIGPSSKPWVLAFWAMGTFAVLGAVAMFPI